MGKYFEIAFEVIYLIGVITMGIIILRRATKKEHKLFGIMALVLGVGDAFHLVPRIIANATDSFASLTPQLGFGKLITSITMTIFYVLLYEVFKTRYNRKENKVLDYTVYLLAGLRIILTLLPQNQWFVTQPPLSFAILRNVPFLILGIIIIYLFIKYARAKNDSYRNMGTAIILSFAFYIPVVLFASIYPATGMLMMPKTVAYVWIVVMGLKDCSKVK